MTIQNSKLSKGLVIYYFGDGKGKTTAALGLALRATGADKTVKIIQFIKGDWETSEEKAAGRIHGIDLESGGLGFVGKIFKKHSLDEHRRAAKRSLETARQAARGDFDVIILDEINWAIKKTLVRVEEVLKIIDDLPASRTLVLTGAPKIDELIKRADIVTEMKKIKHPYDKGIKAIEGIDY